MPEPDLPAPVREYLDLRFPDPPVDRPHVLLNMVLSADGKATVEGSEAGLSSKADKLVLQSLRVHADALLNGAGTARISGASPRIGDPQLRRERRQRGHAGPPLQVVLSSRGDLPADAPLLRRRDFAALIAVTNEAGAEQVARLRASGRPLEVLPSGDATLPELLRRLRQQHGVRLLLLEGGPTINAGCFRAGLVDEFFMTLSPHIVGGRETITGVEGEAFDREGMPALELLSAIPNQETAEVYLHWKVRHRAARRSRQSAARA